MKQASSLPTGSQVSHPHIRSRRVASLLLGAACLTLLALVQANAAPVLFASGTFAGDSTVDTFNFTIAQTSNVTFQTTSYATGGFVPILSLFGSTGAFITDDGGDATCSAGMTASPSTGLCNDASITARLTAGSYTLAISEFDNFPGLALTAPFSEAGNGNFTESYCSGATTPFQEIDLAPCAQRTGAFAITENAVATTPEPSSLALAALPLFALAFVGRRFA